MLYILWRQSPEEKRREEKKRREYLDVEMLVKRAEVLQFTYFFRPILA